MKLFGSVTSPYVRRVRIVLAELGVDYELVDTATDEGQKLLRAKSPIWKVPCALVDGELVVDSHVILDELLKRHAAILPLSSTLSIAEKNRLNFIDATLDSLIQRFYLLKDGVAPTVAYMEKQEARARSAFSALEATLGDDEPLFSHFALALATTTRWISFRSAYPIEAHPRLVEFAAKVEERPSFVATAPR